MMYKYYASITVQKETALLLSLLTLLTLYIHLRIILTLCSEQWRRRRSHPALTDAQSHRRYIYNIYMC